MRAQRKGYWCGIASIANALEMLGIRRSQREIARLCDVSPEHGTDETEMKRALLANGVHVDQWSYHEWFRSKEWLTQQLFLVGPAILCVDNDEHWVTAIGLCKDNYVLFDPSRNTGIEVHDATSLAARWVNSDGVYYGIGVSK